MTTLDDAIALIAAHVVDGPPRSFRVSEQRAILDKLAEAIADRALTSDVTAALAGKSATGHTHPISEVTGLQTALDAKAGADDVAAALAGKSATGHTHPISEVTGLQAALDGKQASSVKLAALAAVAPGADRVMIWDQSESTFVPATLGAGLAISGTQIRAYETIAIACSDRTTPLTTGTGKGSLRLPYALTLTGLTASLVTGQTSGATLTVDLNKWAASMLSTKLTFQSGIKWSGYAPTVQPVFSDTTIAAGDEISVDIDQIGDGTATGLVVYLTGYRP